MIDIYKLLQERAQSEQRVRRILLGLSWCLAELDTSGLCFSPVAAPRTLPWAGTLREREARELVPWLASEEPSEAAVGGAVVNALINVASNPCLVAASPLDVEPAPHLAVFQHFAGACRGQSVVVIGKYPGLAELWSDVPFVCVERRALPDTLPESAAAWLLPRADWVFISASALSNHTLPQLLSWSRAARVVLMGPSLPWLYEWGELGVDYLAGVSVDGPARLAQVIEEGGGTRIFETGAVRYRLLRLR